MIDKEILDEIDRRIKAAFSLTEGEYDSTVEAANEYLETIQGYSYLQGSNTISFIGIEVIRHVHYYNLVSLIYTNAGYGGMIQVRVTDYRRLKDDMREKIGEVLGALTLKPLDK